MSKKKNQNEIHDEAENYYDLKTDAVDRLVNASSEQPDDDAQEVGEKQPDPYKSGFLSRVPTWLKALFIKFWFNGAVCYFILWGLGVYVSDQFLMVLVLAVAQGIIIDLLENNLFRFLQSDDHEYDKWMLFPQKAFWTFFANMLYAFVVVFAVVGIYNGINMLIINIRNLPSDSVPLGVEPLLYGVIYLAVDMAFVGIKNLAVHFAKKRRDVGANSETSAHDEASKPTSFADSSDSAVADSSVKDDSADKSLKRVIVVNQPKKQNKKRKK